MCLLISLGALANNFWTISDSKELNLGSPRAEIEKFVTAKLSTNNFSIFQSSIPKESEGHFPILQLPNPDGGFDSFKIYEAETMSPELQAAYPQIKTYRAFDISNPHKTAKIDFTFWGFHAMVFDGQSTYVVDPYSRVSDDWYVSYYKKDFKRNLNDRMMCEFEEDEHIGSREDAISLNQELPSLDPMTVNGASRREYRLALSCTEEYSAAVGGATPTKLSVLSAMVTTVNRVNGVFERDFGMTAILVPDNDDLIYLPGSSDPFNNNNAGQMLNINNSTINGIIGSSNYDIGHVFSTGGGGLASLGCVCRSNKASGVTGRGNPVGDPFDIDYVAHEMGHQFGGSHTFSSSTGSCSGNGSNSSAYEPGSATTIMGYAGICGGDNIQSNSDDYFHVRSLIQMTTYINGQGNCASQTSAGNTPPAVNSVNTTYNVPYTCPFELEAVASDVDGDPMTYCWEQYDRSGFGTWNSAQTISSRPILRSWDPTADANRTFPRYEKLVVNDLYEQGEIIPNVARDLNFKLTVRDIRNGWGTHNLSDDETTLNVITTTGLFEVSSQNVAFQSINPGPQLVTWNVAGTNAGQINTPNVDIYMSIDTGRSFPFLLATVPNNGSATVNFPNVYSTRARIKVKGADNVFFQLNPTYFTMNGAVWPVGTDDLEQDALKVFPNPSQGLISLELGSTQINKARIYNLQGALMAQYSDGFDRIDISALSSGIYILKLESVDGKEYLEKIVLD